MWRGIGLTTSGLLLAASALAQSPSASVPTPSEFHGFDVSKRYIVTSRIVDYYRMLGETSPRVKYSEYGKSIMDRPLPMLMIGSEKNLARAEEIRQLNQRLSNSLQPLSAAELDRAIADLPTLVWIFIVDVDEEAGMNVLQEVAHDLATREDAEAKSIRDNVVVIMTPMTNPDSHARYVNWQGLFNVKGASLDPNAAENTSPWGETDGNAFGIDVNRDFSTFVSPEMRALARNVVKWHPQFWLDIHSGPPVIFIPPFPRPFHPLWPEEAPKWWNVIARQASENFGKKGFSFSSREGYEGVTSPQFGLSWGMLGPSVSGMLFETFGGRGGATTEFVRSDGTIGTMRMGMDRHAEGIWSVLQVARDHRLEILRDANKVMSDAVAEARKNPERGVVIPASGVGVDPDKVERLVNRLALQGVEVRRTSEPFAALASNFFDLGTVARQNFAAGSYVVDFVQPQARLARALLDPTIKYTDAEVEVPFRTKMPYYDSSYGNLALLFGVPAFAVHEPFAVKGDLVSDVDGHATRGGIQVLGRSELPYAWILPSGDEASYRTAIDLLQGGYKVRAFRSGFRNGKNSYPAGTFAFLRDRNPEGFPAHLKEVAAKYGAAVVEIAGPFTDAGTTFGNEQGLRALAKPLVAVVADDPVTMDHTYGGIRNTLEADFGFTFSPVKLATINRVDLSKYTAVVLPHAGMDVRGGPAFDAGYRGLLNLANVRRYVQGGGTLIVTKGASEYVMTDSVLGKSVSFKGYATHTNGVTLRAEWLSHPTPEKEIVVWKPGLGEVGMPMLGASYQNRDFAAPGLYPVLLGVREEGDAEVVARYSTDPKRILLDGYMFDEDRAKLAGSPLVIIQPAGRGRVIYLAEDITFRGQWYGLNQLFLNILLFGPLM